MDHDYRDLMVLNSDQLLRVPSKYQHLIDMPLSHYLLGKQGFDVIGAVSIEFNGRRFVQRFSVPSLTVTPHLYQAKLYMCCRLLQISINSEIGKIEDLALEAAPETPYPDDTMPRGGMPCE